MRKHIYTIALSLLAAVTMVGCQEDYSPVDNIPVVETSAAENVWATKATLCGVITKEAYDDFNFSYFEEQAPHYFFLLSEHKDLTDSTRVDARRDSDTCYAEVSGLTPATTYYYALCVANDYSMVMGEMQSLTTEAKSITQVQSYPVEEYFVNTATLTGFFVAETRCSAAFSLSEYPHFPDTASKVLEANVLKDSCYALVEDLKPATTYYYRLSVSDNYITVTETEGLHQFTTFAMPVTVNLVEECTQTSATLTGTFVNNGMDYENLCFMYSTDKGFSEESTKSISPTCQGNVCMAKVEGLQSSTTYYYKLSVILFVNGKECLMESGVYSFTTGEYELTSGQMIDLGLSVNWAAWNVGATSPEEYGGYYAWGETEEKKSYTPTTYKYYLADYDYDGEAWFDSDEYENIGYNISGTSYDVAHMKWGDGWRMPTPEEIAELIKQCTWKEIRYKGTNGWLVIGPNGNNIFLPAAGCYGNGDVNYSLGEDFYIWSSVLTVDNIRPYVLASNDDGRDYIVCDYFFWVRFQGLSVRPVKGEAKDKENPVTVIADAVDLGLSVKWASHNIGATVPEEYGGEYAWGETEEKYWYVWSTYKWCNDGDNDDITKYCISRIEGTVDNKTTLESEDDVACVKWGNGWRMPTLYEMQELLDKCTWEWISLNGMYGYKVTASNGNYIFLPSLDEAGSGYYWTKTLYSNSSLHSYALQPSKNYLGIYDQGRYSGFAVRPVYDSKDNNSDVDLEDYPEDENWDARRRR